MADEQNESALVSAAKKVGAAAGKVASLAGAAAGKGAAAVKKATAQSSQSSPKPEKFQKKTTGRVPRREKKARQKAGTL